ncbi:histidine kinase [Rhodococcus sp. 3Y1]
MENSQAVADLHRDRERKIANAVVAERQDMARELHDVAAHHMTGMIIQARAADKFFSSNPEQAQALLGASSSRVSGPSTACGRSWDTSPG